MGMAKNFIAACIGLSLFIVTLSASYYFVIYLPSKDKLEAESKTKIELLKLQAEESKKNIYKNCASEAADSAKELLKEKAGMQNTISAYQEAAKKGLYLKDDYDYAFNDCLRKNGILK